MAENVERPRNSFRVLRAGSVREVVVREETWGLGRQLQKSLRSPVKEFGFSPTEGSSKLLEDINPGSESDRSVFPRLSLAASWVGSGRGW